MKPEFVARAIEIAEEEQQKDGDDIKQLALEKLIFMLKLAVGEDRIVCFWL